MPTVAAITLVYNEVAKLPIWIAYYSRQLGVRSCYVVDHGSDDGSTEGIDKAQIVRLPRTPFDDQTRMDAISSLSHFLLKYYDYVIYVDCDEILVADPAEFSGIGDFCNKIQPDYITSIGIDIVHMLGTEPPLRADELITKQRSFGHFSAAMCKPNLTKLPIKWSPGFHSHQYPPAFGSLFNFHLRYVDLDQGFRRQAITRNLKWAQTYEGAHQRAPDTEFERLIRHWNALPVILDDPLTREGGVLPAYLKHFVESASRSPDAWYYRVDLSTFGEELIAIPERFKGVF